MINAHIVEGDLVLVRRQEHAQPGDIVVMPLKTQFYGMREFAVTDPDGHIITFAERVSVP